MDEDEYHKYISETHAGLLMELLIANKIVSYTMVRFISLCVRQYVVLTLLQATQHDQDEGDDPADIRSEFRQLG